MSREIKFRCWDVVLKYWLKPDDMPTLMSDEVGEIWEFGGQDDYIFCQWTGLKDKNGLEYIYEGDIIDVDGLKKGNVYENKQEATDLVIEGFGTKTWMSTYQKAMERGCKNAE